MLGNSLGTSREPSTVNARRYCGFCNAQPAGFLDNADLDRHIDQQHSVTRKVWVCRNPPHRPHWLDSCRTCRNGKIYASKYNVAAHLRRSHFGLPNDQPGGGQNECESANVDGENKHPVRARGGRNKKRPGRGSVDEPSMDELEPYMCERLERNVNGSGVWEVVLPYCDVPNTTMSPEQHRLSNPIYHSLSLEHEPGLIRVLRLLPGSPQDGDIRCILNVASGMFDAHRTYEALSYMWGPADLLQHITINERRFPVRQNLFDALLRLRNPDIPRDLWVDAICIDQDNRKEKGQQVAQMASVYGSAKRVLIWLGLATDATAPALEYLRTFTTAPPPRPPTETERLALLEMCSLEYWSRVWIVQEIVLASEATIVHADIEIPWSEFETAVLESVSNPTGMGERLQYEKSSRFRRLSEDRKQYFLSFGQEKSTLEDAIYRHGNIASTDARDRVYGLLGLAEPTPLRVDYFMNVETLFINVIHACKSRDPAKFAKVLLRILSVDANHFGHTIDLTSFADMRPPKVTAWLRRCGNLDRCRNQRVRPRIWSYTPANTALPAVKFGAWRWRGEDAIDAWLSRDALQESFHVDDIPPLPSQLEPGLESGDMVYQIEGTQMALVRSTSAGPTNKNMALVTLEAGGLVRWNGAYVKTPCFDFLEFELRGKASHLYVKMRCWLFLELVRISCLPAWEAERLACCHYHDPMGHSLWQC